MGASHSAVVDGIRLHWAECGATSDRNPVVLLHGLNDSHLTWKRIAPLLAGNRRVLMPDAPGSGLSERPDASYRLAWHAHLIARWLEDLGLSEVDIVGHSFGGGVAQMMLLEPNLTIRRLGLVASGGLGPRVAFWLRMAALPGVVEHFGQPFMAAGTRLTLRAAGCGISEQDIEELSVMNAEFGSARAFARTVQDVISWRGQTRHFLHRAHEIEKLPAITLFWGDKDTITPIEDAIAFAREVEGVGFERFEGGGHYIHHDYTEAFTLKLRAFLDTPQRHLVRLPVLTAKIGLAVRARRAWAGLLDTLVPWHGTPLPAQPGHSAELVAD